MVFLWLGGSFLLLVRVEGGRSRPVPAAVVFGLGCLIRPELVLGSAILLAALLMLARPKEGGSRRKQGAVLLLAALALPLAYELFRMAYYALGRPFHRLAKAAGASWWSQGATYLWNLRRSLHLLVAAGPRRPGRRGPHPAWWRAGDGRRVASASPPPLVVARGRRALRGPSGWRLHARPAAPPGLFALLLPVCVALGRLRGMLVVPVVGIVVWAVVCAGWLRFVPPEIAGLTPQTVFISNERNSWITATGEAHPVTAGDYRRALSGAAAAASSGCPERSRPAARRWWSSPIPSFPSPRPPPARRGQGCGSPWRSTFPRSA